MRGIYKRMPKSSLPLFFALAALLPFIGACSPAKMEHGLSELKPVVRQIHFTEGPSARSHIQTALDVKRRRWLAYGGLDAENRSLGDLWSLDLKTFQWRLESSAPTDINDLRPLGRHGGRAHYDARFDGFFLFGGLFNVRDAAGRIRENVLSDSWAWHANRKAQEENSWQMFCPTSIHDALVLPHDKRLPWGFFEPGYRTYYLLGGGVGEKYQRPDDLSVAEAPATEPADLPESPLIYKLSFRANPRWERLLPNPDKTSGLGLPDPIAPAGAYDPDKKTVWLYGGWERDENDVWQYSDKLWRYSGNQNTWTFVEPNGKVRPPALVGAAAFWNKTGRCLIVVGGHAAGEMRSVPRVWLWLTESAEWRDLSAIAGLPTADGTTWRGGVFAAVEADFREKRLLVFGGRRVKPLAARPVSADAENQTDSSAGPALDAAVALEPTNELWLFEKLPLTN
jgi:hypothetical protein